MRSFLRDLAARTVIQVVVTAIFLAPLGVVAGSEHVDLSAAIPQHWQEPEGEPWGEARFLVLPEVVDVDAEVVVAETDADAEPTTEPDPEPVIPPRESAPASPAKAGGSAPELEVVGGRRAVRRAEGVAGMGTGDATGDGEGRAKAAPASKPSKGKRRNCDKPHPNVHTGNDGIVEIDRALVDHYTRNLERFMELGYSRPYDEGDVHGWYVSGFSCNSPVSKAGFQRGDVLLSVNGKKTRTWVGVFMTYQKLKNKDDFTVQIVRKGEPVTLRFRVVEGGTFEG
ncbi:MAG: PDZ domain-containing protein [Alphaproteobacteria bacterium]|nr:PDZ domain-containing protein [Alphaproteobacteria bacterium]MCB9699818.1 PDZ domain-containing protein [Alphaproteobacteria bacterium]